MLKNRFRVRLLIYMYGGEIIQALTLDALLHRMHTKGMVGFTFYRNRSTIDDAMIKDLRYLTKEGYISSYDQNYYDITKEGELKLASGGFVADAKKNKNALFAFRISIVAITLSVISFIVSLLSE